MIPGWPHSFVAAVAVRLWPADDATAVTAELRQVVGHIIDADHWW